MSYKFKVGDKVQHDHHLTFEGVVKELVSFDPEEGVAVNALNDEDPWYYITWTSEGGDEWVGLETEWVLIQSTL